MLRSAFSVCCLPCCKLRLGVHVAISSPVATAALELYATYVAAQEGWP